MTLPPADWDATGIDFTVGASGTGLPGGIAYDTGNGNGTSPAAPYQPGPGAGPQPPPVTGRVLDTLAYLRLKVLVLEASGDADRIDAAAQSCRGGQQLLSWSPVRQICDDAAALLRRGAS